MFKAKKKPIPTRAEYQTAWIGACSPHVPGPIQTVALLNPAGAVATQAAAVAGRSVGGLAGRLIATKAAEASFSGTVTDHPLPAVVAAVLTESSLHLLEAEVASADGDELRIVGLYETWGRHGMHLEVQRKLMSERLTFTLADGRRIELDGMFVGRQKERLYQPLIDALRG